MIQSLDLDNNGQVEWKEFACLMADRWLRQDGETDLQLALGLLSTEDDAEVELERVRGLLCKHGEAPLTETEWEQLRELADPNKTGRVSAAAFAALPCWKPSVPPGWVSPRRRASIEQQKRAGSSAGAPK